MKVRITEVRIIKVRITEVRIIEDRITEDTLYYLWVSTDMSNKLCTSIIV